MRLVQAIHSLAVSVAKTVDLPFPINSTWNLNTFVRSDRPRGFFTAEQSSILMTVCIVPSRGAGASNGSAHVAGGMRKSRDRVVRSAW